MSDYRRQLTTLAERMSDARGISEARIANLAGCDGAFFRRMRDGGGCRVDTFNRVISFFSDSWPENAAWPHDLIDRPSSEKAA